MKKFSLENFLASGHNEERRKNEHLLISGDISRKVYFILEGIVRHYIVDYTGAEKTIRISKENDFFSSNVSYWKGTPSYINCQSLSSTKLLYWSKPELDHLRANHIEFVYFENSKFIDFMVEKHDKEVSRLTLNAEERLNDFNQKRSMLFNRIPHHIIASYLDMTPETLSRLRAKMKNRKS